MQSFLALLEYKCRTTAIRKQFRKHCKEPFADGGRLCNQHELNYFVWRRTSEKTPSAELAASYRKSVRMDTYYVVFIGHGSCQQIIILWADSDPAVELMGFCVHIIKSNRFILILPKWDVQFLHLHFAKWYLRNCCERADARGGAH